MNTTLLGANTLKPSPLMGEGSGGVYGPDRLVTELTGWMGDRFGHRQGGPADAMESDLSDGRENAVYRSGFGGRG